MKTKSNAQIIKELYIELLSDYNQHSRTELFSFVRKNSTDTFTDGMLAGALRTLIQNNNNYINTSRGYYIKLKPNELCQASDPLVKEYTEIFCDALKKANSITSDPFHIMKMSSEDIQRMNDIEQCINLLSETIDKIRYK